RDAPAPGHPAARRQRRADPVRRAAGRVLYRAAPRRRGRAAGAGGRDRGRAGRRQPAGPADEIRRFAGRGRRGMIRAALIFALVVAAAPVWSQTPRQRPSTDITPGTRAESVSPLVQGEVARANAALLRGLDKVSGQSTDLPLLVGDSLTF